MTGAEAIRQASILVTVLLTDEIITEKEAEILRGALEQPSDIDAAVRAENEACAKVCEEWGVYEAIECAAIIRERMK